MSFKVTQEEQVEWLEKLLVDREGRNLLRKLEEDLDAVNDAEKQLAALEPEYIKWKDEILRRRALLWDTKAGIAKLLKGTLGRAAEAADIAVKAREQQAQASVSDRPDSVKQAKESEGEQILNSLLKEE